MKKLVYKIVIMFLITHTILYANSIFHSSPDIIDPNQPTLFTVETSQELENASLSIFYKLDTEANYIEETFDSVAPSTFQLLLTPVISGEERLDYYIQARKTDGTIITYPEYTPKEAPLIIPIKKVEILKPVLSIITPEKNEIIKEDFPIIMFSLEDPIKQLDLSTLVIKLDDKDITRKATVTYPFISYLPEKKLAQGEHKVYIFLRDKQNNTYTIKNKFKLEKIKPSFFEIKGNLNLNQSYYNSDKENTVQTRKEYEMQFSSTTEINSPYFKSKLFIKRDNRNDKTKQSLNRTRYSISDKSNHLYLSVGDTAPRFSKLTYSGRRSLGSEIKLDTLKWLGLKNFLTLQVAHGDTKTKIPTQTSVTQGTFKQTMSGIKLGLNFGKLNHYINYIKINDDLSSLTDSEAGITKPLENHVLSFGLDYKLFNLTKLSWEIAGSAHYTDASAESIDPSELDIGIPQSTLEKISKTLPIKASFIGGYASRLDFLTPVFKRNIIFKLKSNWTHADYTSLGNSGIKKDNFDYSTGLDFRLLKNTLNLNTLYKSERNNVDENESSTLFADTIRVNSSYSWFNVGNINLGYSTTSRFNKNKPGENDTAIKNKQDSYTLGINNINLKIKNTTHILNTNYSNSSFTNDITQTSSYETRVIRLDTSTKLNNFTIKTGVNNSIKDNKSATPNSTVFTTIYTKMSYDYVPEVLTTYTGIKVTRGVNNGADLTQHTDSGRLTLSFGTTLNIPSYLQFINTRLRLNIDFNKSDDHKKKDDRTVNFSDTFITLGLNTRF